jgi:gliding motility-associated-like protein
MKIRCEFASLAMAFLFIWFLSPVNAQTGQKTWSQKWGNARVFTENKGQYKSTDPADPTIYVFDDGQTLISFTKHAIVYTLAKKEHKTERELFGKRRMAEEEENEAICKKESIQMIWDGANPSTEIIPSEETSDYSSYSYSQNGVTKNINHLRCFKKLLYKNIYPFIDIEYSFHPSEGIKYTLILNPGADIRRVKMNYPQNRKVRISRTGDMLLKTFLGDITDHAPVSYYSGNTSEKVSSRFALLDHSVSFELGSFDHSRTVVIDPWTITPALANSNKVWEVEHDAGGNAYIYGGDSPLTLKKYNPAGVLQWTYATPWDTAHYWIGTFITDLAGNSYITSGSNGEISKVNTSGALVWHNNPNGAFGPLFEYWHLAFNCDQTQLVAGGMRNTNPLATNTLLGAIMNINLANGAVSNYVIVGYMTSGFPPTIKEVRSICSAPNGNFYYLTLDSLGTVNQSLVMGLKIPSTYNFSYGSPSYGVTNQGISAIRANGKFVYTQNGTTLHKRSLSSGAILATATIAGGLNTSGFGGTNSPGNSGLDIDSCGNVYVGSGNAVLKYDANLNFLASGNTGGKAVYDVSVNTNGEVLVCGPGYAASINMSACYPMKLACITCPTLNPPSQTNPSCKGAATGSATVSASGGSLPYTYSWSPSGGNAVTASNLAAGTYTCIISDAGGCSLTQTITITDPAGITASASQTGSSCSGSGSASCTASGGTGTLSYSWTPSGGTAASASGLTPGTYTCTVTDSKGCSQAPTVTITSGSGPVVTLSSKANPSCNGGSNGTATVSASGGTAPYAYTWSPSGGTAASASGLAAGNYTVLVKDASACSQSLTVTITQPPAISGTASSTNTGCGTNTGSATVTASGGTGTLAYSWSPSGGNGSTASSLGAGTYTCIITDANACTKALTAIVNTNGGPTVTVSSQTSPKCFGGSTGSATVSVSGGASPYTYSWTPSGGTTATASGLTAGTYTISVKDAGGCLQSQAITLTQPAAISASVSTTNSSCTSNTGSASVTASGGTGAYTYSWSPSGGNSATATAIGAGSYTCFIMDANGCTYTANANVSSTGGPIATLSSKSNPACNGGNTGSATVGVSGGTNPYTYSWSTNPAQTSATASGLAAGTYSLTVKDGAGCSTILSVTMAQPAAISLLLSSTSVCGPGRGSASALASGGTGSFAYMWLPTGGTTSSAINIPSGSYTCTATDSNGCQKSATVTVYADTIPEASAGPDVQITFGSSVTLHAGGGSSYLWYPMTGLSCDTCPNVSISPSATARYCVIAKTIRGCTDTACVNVKVDYACGEVFVPNFFSPNADGSNDKLCVYSKCIRSIDFSIFDRWGERVFQTADPNEMCWDGSYKGEPMNSAVFVYYLKATLVTGDVITQKGNISLVR